MKLATFLREREEHIGVVVDEDQSIVDLTAAGEGAGPFGSMQQLIDAGADGLARAADLAASAPAVHRLPTAGTQLRAPLPRPVRVRDCTLFTEHLEPGFRALARHQAASAEDPERAFEQLMASGMYDLPEVLRTQPVYYNADALSISGPDDVIVVPPISRQLDYELEFAAVIATTCRDVDLDRAAERIFGFTIYNDWSLRDVQARVMRSNLGPAEGKDFEGGTTLGPFLVTRDEIGDPYDLQMSARVNGEQWSSGSSATMAHSFEQLIVQLTRGKRLYAGEVLGSGTVLSGSGFELGRQLHDGDVVELEVEGIGCLRNQVQYAATA